MKALLCVTLLLIAACSASAKHTDVAHKRFVAKRSKLTDGTPTSLVVMISSYTEDVANLTVSTTAGNWTTEFPSTLASMGTAAAQIVPVSGNIASTILISAPSWLNWVGQNTPVEVWITMSESSCTFDMSYLIRLSPVVNQQFIGNTQFVNFILDFHRVASSV